MKIIKINLDNFNKNLIKKINNWICLKTLLQKYLKKIKKNVEKIDKYLLV
jgi:hypothetical protein